MSLSPIVVRQSCNSLAAHRTGQQSRSHRRIADDANPLPRCERQDLVLDLAMEQRISRLQRRKWGNRSCPVHLSDAEIGNADIADLPLLLQRGHCLPALFQLLVRLGPVHLVEIDRVHLKPPQASLAFASHGIGLEAVANMATLIPSHAAFGEYVGAVADTFERPRDDLLRMAQSIDSRGVDPVDTGVERLVNGRDRVIVALSPPAKFPSRATDRPGPKTDRSNVQIRVSQLSGFHERRSSSSL